MIFMAIAKCKGGTLCFTEMIEIHPKWDPGPDPQGVPLLLLDQPMAEWAPSSFEETLQTHPK
jgi:hypothetical protein